MPLKKILCWEKKEMMYDSQFLVVIKPIRISVVEPGLTDIQLVCIPDRWTAQVCTIADNSSSCGQFACYLFPQQITSTSNESVAKYSIVSIVGRLG